MLMVHACDEANARRSKCTSWDVPRSALLSASWCRWRALTVRRVRRCECTASSALRCVVQVASHIVANPQDKTEVTLVFGNVSEDDILIKDLLDGLAKKDPKRFKVGGRV